MGETARRVPISLVFSLLTQNREHIPLSQGHHDEEAGGETEGGSGGEENTWRTEHGCSFQKHTFPLLPSLSA